MQNNFTSCSALNCFHAFVFHFSSRWWRRRDISKQWQRECVFNAVLQDIFIQSSRLLTLKYSNQTDVKLWACGATDNASVYGTEDCRQIKRR
ncbi:hypothetical protein T11_9278 [Trichinella zimbabwensis]|uniref:Uncharacterized protein n=1 Tax=Trichinella zimbabwensis TaxID=268475 RepID=A0A0V1H5P2_9BILA|nr:hypothetical protein T11_9278 [Trichinella zimbabwensis]